MQESLSTVAGSPPRLARTLLLAHPWPGKMCAERIGTAQSSRSVSRTRKRGFQQRSCPGRIPGVFRPTPSNPAELLGWRGTLPPPEITAISLKMDALSDALLRRSIIGSPIARVPAGRRPPTMSPSSATNSRMRPSSLSARSSLSSGLAFSANPTPASRSIWLIRSGCI